LVAIPRVYGVGLEDDPLRIAIERVFEKKQATTNLPVCDGGVA